MTLMQVESHPEVAGSTAWALGQIGRHSTDHTNSVAGGDNLTHLVNLAVNDASPPDVKSKVQYSGTITSTSPVRIAK